MLSGFSDAPAGRAGMKELVTGKIRLQWQEK